MTFPMKRTLYLWFALLLPVALASCGNDDTSEDSGIAGASWKQTETASSAGEEKTYSFRASGNWTARSDQSWCNVTTSSGAAGNSELTIVTTANTTGSLRTAAVIVSVSGYTPVRFQVSQPGGNSGGSGADAELNRMVDQYLAENYLWNGDYKKLNRDLSLDYVSAQRNFLKITLLGMTTNTLDKKQTQSGYRIYSYLNRESASKTVHASRAGVNHSIKREEEYNFGIAGITIVSYHGADNKPTGEYAFAVSAVYPGSPAAEAGIKRGTLIRQIDSKAIDETNYEERYYTLISPGSAQSLTVTEHAAGSRPVTLQARLLYPTPVIHEEVIEEGTHKIGYLVYLSFDAAYDDDLLAAVKRFRDAGINELILDLRNNGGGHVISSKMLSTCIAGAACDGKVFEYYRYNADRMADPTRTERETGHGYDKTVRKFYENFAYGNYYGVDLRQYTLNLSRLYVLTTDATASSSEAVIHSLRGIGFPVTLVGEPTEGKNVGMEVKKLTVGNYTYELAPITFQSYNAEDATVDPAGLPVELAVKDWDNGYVDFGDRSEPLLVRALSQITGKSYRAAVPSRTRAGELVPVPNVALPALPNRPNGMLALPPQPEEE